MRNFSVHPFTLIALLAGFVLLLSAKPLSTISIKNSSLVEHTQLTRHIELSEGVSKSELIDFLQREFQLPIDFGLADKNNVYRDQLGLEHQRVIQTIGGIPIYGSSLSLHKQNGKIVAVSGPLLGTLPSNSFNTSPFSDEDILSIAKTCVGAKTYMWEDAKMEAFIKKEKGDSNATHFPMISRTYLPNDYPKLSSTNLRAAYVLEIYAKDPLTKKELVIDALTGAILFESNKIKHSDEPGTAHTAYSGTRDITTHKPDTFSPYELQNLTYGNGVRTFDCFDTDDYFSAALPTNTTNDWDYPTLIGDAILDAHWGGEKTYEYFQDLHNWSSFDNNGSTVNSYVHFSLIDFGYFSNSNAFWDGERLTFGDGTPGVNNPLTSIDIYAHEFVHGVTEFSADLEYLYEPGALNESFSDIFGMCLKYYAKPEDFNWLIGFDVYVSGATGLRNLSDPNEFDNPDTYQGDFWEFGSFDNGGVHINSGVQNYWFYLISDGDSGTNDNGDAFSVSAIGIESAELIAFRTLTVYLNQSSNYDDARFFSIMSAEDLFGPCSPEVISVTNAWHAVGVGDPYNEAVVADFQVSNNYACSIPATISMIDFSINASSYTWDFGDGTTSTDASPVHVYTNAGIYTISLIVEGNSLCNTNDTVVLIDALLVEDNEDLIAPECIPTPTSILAGGGIASFSLLSIENESEDSQFPYEDFSCEFQETVTEGNLYPVELELYNSGYVSIWLDGNNDGDFTADEIAYQSSEDLLVHSFDWLVPGVSVFDTRLRLRLMYDDDVVGNPCSLTNAGQAEDYTIQVSNNTLPPISNFMASSTTALPYENIDFQDLSLNVPTNWSWEFPGASITTSSDQNMSLTYDTIGSYDVTLIVSNQYGNDTLSIPNYINIVYTIDMCNLSMTNAPNGIIYDSGGENGNYSNNEYCAFLIAPECAENVTISFPLFSTESNYDYVRIYDGSSDNAPLLGSFSGTQNLSPITSSGSEIFIVFDSDGSVTASGFEINWESNISASEPFGLNITADNDNPPLGASIQFFDGSSDLANNWSWDFGDGSTSTLQNPTHQYLSSGTKTIILEASNCDYMEYDTLIIDVQQSGQLLLSPNFQDLSILNCGDSVSSNFLITNTGQGDLLVSFNNSSESLFDSFEEETINETVWESVTGVISNSCGVYSGDEALYFDNDFEREAITQAFTLTVFDTLSFYLKYASEWGSCEEVDSGEHIEVSYRLIGTNTWVSIENFADLSSYHSFNQINIVPDNAYINMPVQFRIRQVDHSGSGSDNWAIDDFEIKQSGSSISFSPNTTTIPASESQTINFTIYRNNRIAGVYDNMFLISTNIVELPIVAYPINLTIEGEGILGFPQDCEVFNTIQEFTVDSQKVVLYNSGCGIIEIENIVSSHSDFILNYQGNTLIPNDSLVIDLIFAPQTFANFEETLTITYDNGLEAIICLEAISLGAPLISSNPEILELELIDCQDSLQGYFTLFNSGNGPLNFAIQREILEDFENGLDGNLWTLDGGEIGDAPCGNNSGNTSCYFYLNGERSLETKDMNVTNQSTISFFLKYGNSSLCEWVEFGEHVVFEYSTDGVNWNLINAYEDINNSQYIEFTETIPIDALSPNTRFRWIQPSHSGSSADFWVVDDIRFEGSSNDFTFETNEGIIGEGNSLDVNFTYYRQDKLVGQYEENIVIINNDPTQLQTIMPVSVVINGAAEFAYNGPNCYDFGTIFNGTTTVDSIFIENTGCAPLTISSATASNAAYTLLSYSQTITPQEAGSWFTLEFAPQTTGIFEATLNINTPQGIENICILGESLPAPVISVTPEVLNINFNLCSDSVVVDVLVENTGESTLTYETNNIFSSDLRLDTLLTRWLQNGPSLTQLIPNFYNFSGGESGTSISDGGGDMYDTGNILNTNYTNSISYTGNTITANSAFGQEGQYFTSKIPGMFLMAADLDDVSSFSITGNLGADGSGTKEETTLSYTSNLNKMYTGYASRVYDSFDPSINHLIITQSDDNVEASIIAGTSNENHLISNLQNTNRIYYILFATNSGNNFVSDQIFQDVFENFVEVILPNLSDIVSVQQEVINLEPNDSSSISLVFQTEDLQPGIFNFVLPITSNDPNSPTTSIPVTVNAIDIPCAEFEYSQPDECLGEIQFTDLSPVGTDTWFWSFGDGNTANIQNPTHTYEESGTYTISLISGSNLVLSEYLITLNLLIESIEVAMEFTELSSDGSISFSGTSDEGETWLWDFGDGTTDESQNVSHTYEQPGLYTVSLTTFDTNGCSGTVSETIGYMVGIPSLSTNLLTIFPNPNQGMFSIQKRTASTNMKVSLYDVNGKLLIAPFSIFEETITIDIQNQPNGIYLLKVQSQDDIYYNKIVKQ